MANIEKLSVKLSSDTSSFRRGMDRARRALGEVRNNALQAAKSLDTTDDEMEDLQQTTSTTSKLMHALANSSDEAGDELGQLARQLSGIVDNAVLARKALDSVDDEMDQVARSAALASAATTGLGSSLTGVSGGIRTFGKDASGASGNVRQLNRSLNESNPALRRAGNNAYYAGDGYKHSGYYANYYLRKNSLLNKAMSTQRMIGRGMAYSMLPALAGSLLGVAGAAAGLATGFGAIMATGFYAWGQKLASANKARLSEVNKEIKALNQVKKETGALTKAQQKRLRVLEQERKKLRSKSTVMGALNAQLDETRSVIKQNALAIGQQFIPVVKGAVEALPAFTQSMFDALGSLKPFVPALKQLGRTAAYVLPQLVSMIMDAGRSALPEFRRLVSYIRNNAVPAFKWIASITRRTYPELKRLAIAVFNLIKPYTEMGVMLVQLVAPILTDIVQLVTRAVKAFNSLPPSVQKVTAAFVILGPYVYKFGRNIKKLTRYMSVTAALTKVLGGRLLGIVAPIGVAATALLLLERNFLSLRTTLERVFGVFVQEVNKTVAVARTQLGPLGAFIAGVFKRITGSARSAGSAFVRHIGGKMIRAIRLLGQVTRQVLVRIGTWWRTHQAQVIATTNKIAITVQKGIGIVNKYFGDWRTALLLILPSLLGIISPLGLATKGAKSLGLALVPVISRFGKFLALTSRVATRIAAVVLSTKTYRTALMGLRNAITTAWAAGSKFVTLLRRMGTFLTLLPGKVVTLVARLGKLLFTFRGLKTLFISALPLLRTVGIAIAGLGTPIAVVAAAVAGLYLAWKTNLFGIRSITMQVFHALKAAIRGDMSQVRYLVAYGVARMRQVWKQNLLPMLQQAKQTFNQIKTVVGNALNWLYTNAFQPVVRSIERLWRLHGQSLFRELKETWAAIKPVVMGALKLLVSLFRSSTSTMSSLWNQYGDEILSATKFVFDAIGSVIGAFFDSTLTGIKIFLNVIQGDWKEAFNELSGLTHRILNGLTGFVGKWTSGLVSDFRQAGRDLVRAFAKGIRSMGGAAKGAVNDVVSDVRKMLPGSDAKEGPLSDLTASGAALPETFAQGMEQKVQAVATVSHDMAQTAQPMTAASPTTQSAGGRSVSIRTINIHTDAETAEGLARDLDNELAKYL